MLPGCGTCCSHYVARGATDDIQWAQHYIYKLAQEMFLDGTLKLAGWEPLPSDLDPAPDLELPPPALQICGFKDELVTAPAEYHKWQTSAHLADEFEMVRQRWLGFS